MAGGSKKKKTKPAANPARGFATKSVPKASNVTVNDIESSTASQSGVATPDTAATSVETSDNRVKGNGENGSRELHELSPEELEAQLEESELQQFAEAYAAKVRKEASRQTARLTTDRRILRGQAEFLSVKRWLPEELMQQVLDLALSERPFEQYRFARQKPLTSDDLLAKLWTLRTCLLSLDVPPDLVSAVLSWLVANPPDAGGSTWGLVEALDWLALHTTLEELPEYDHQKQNHTGAENGEDFEHADEFASEHADDEFRRVTADKRDPPLSPMMPSSDSMDPGTEDVEVSDIDSDLEPDELLATYLRSKAKLFNANAALVDEAGSKKKRKTGTPSAPPASSSGEKKLVQRLQKIESDVLFDQWEADVQWAVMRVDLAQDAADRRKAQLPQDDHAAKPTYTAPDAIPTTKGKVSDEAERVGLELLKESQNRQDSDMLGGIFDALPGVADSTGGTGADQANNVTVRNLGKLTGLSARRVLEEACKARDSSAKFQYRLISTTTYTSRHALTIRWAKVVEPVDASYLSAVEVENKPRSTTFSAVHTATPDEAQSEAFISTLALFLVFAGSPKEEKAHLRLPSALRDLWDELVQSKQEFFDAQNRSTIQDLRTLVEQSLPQHDEADADDEVVFKAGSRVRSVVPSGVSTPVPERDTTSGHHVFQELAELWKRKSSTPSYQRMLVARMNLPIHHYRDTIVEAISRARIVVLVSETGSGKSTQLPAFILEHELSQGRHCKVYCTEPRRISAISLAHRVSEEMGEYKNDVGTTRSLVGYAIRLESHTSPTTRLVYATTGIVLRMLENGDGLGDITHLVVDEVHERSIDTDFLLIMLRSLMQRKPDLRVILMSATVNAQRFSDYLDGAPIIDVPGRTFPVQAQFLEDAIELTGHTSDDAPAGEVDEDDMADSEGAPKATSSQQLAGYSARTRNTLATYDEYRMDYGLIVKLLYKVAYDARYTNFSKAILVFLPGIGEIRQLNDMLGGHPAFSQGWRVYPLHSSFSSEDQQAAFDIPPRNMRKIVLATNIAETGITIPDVTCVIDVGKHKEMRYDEKRQMSRLIMSFIARANAKQRRGRAGRVQEGICFHLFTKQRHDELMAESQTPEMLRLSLQDLVMRVKICRLGDIESALSQALDPPSVRNIRRAIDALVEVGALTTSEELTPLGAQLAKLPLDAQLGKLILLASCWGCLDFALTAAATLSSKTPFLSPMGAKKQADTVRLGFKRGDSDLETSYNAYCAWRKICITQGISEFNFCSKNFLSPQNLANIEDLKGQLLASLVDAGFVQLDAGERVALSRVRPGRQRHFVALPEKYCMADSNDATIASVVAWSFYPKIIRRDGKGWRNIANNQSLALHPASVNKASLSPEVKLLSFYSILQSTSKYTNAQETTPTPELALVLLAGDAVFHMYAGVIVIDGNRLRYKVHDWKTMIALKTLRSKLKEVMARTLRAPGKELTGKHAMWFEVATRMFELQMKV